MIIKRRVLYDYDFGTLEFVPVKNVPQYSHRVIINRRPIGWLSSDTKPNIKSARYFIERHINNKEK